MDLREENFVLTSQKIKTDDIDWEEAKQIGLTEDEAYLVTFFSDIESQTIIYFRDLVKTDLAFDPEAIAFLTTWNYEEFYHGYYLAKLLAECSTSLQARRVEHLRRKANFSETFQAVGGWIFSKLNARAFGALALTWGSIQEATTLSAYKSLGAHTKNPALQKLAQRIGLQEYRHMGWYYTQALKRLEESETTRKLTRFFLKRLWEPVGSGVKPAKVISYVLSRLFPGKEGLAAADFIDERIQSLPGLEGLVLMRPHIEAAQRINSIVPPDYKEWRVAITC